MAVALFLFRFVSVRVCVSAQNTLKLVNQIQLSHKATHSPMHVTQGISKNKKKKKVTVQNSRAPKPRLVAPLLAPDFVTCCSFFFSFLTAGLSC